MLHGRDSETAMTHIFLQTGWRGTTCLPNVGISVGRTRYEVRAVRAETAADVEGIRCVTSEALSGGQVGMKCAVEVVYCTVGADQ